MTPGLSDAQPMQPPEQEQPPSMMDQYVGDEEMGDDADTAAEAAMGMVSNPDVGPALMQLQKSAQAFPQQGQQAFRNPETLQALSLALKPIIGQSKGSSLGNGEIVGDVSIADLIPTDRGTMLVKLLIQPTDEGGEPTRDPYEAMLTDGRIPEAQGGKPRELTQQEVQQALQTLAKVYQIQQQYPDDIARISQGMQGGPPPEHQPLESLIH